MGYYTRDIEMPKTNRDGLANFLQLIINELETDNANEALLKAVDLWNDISSGTYDEAIKDASGENALAAELTRKHQAELIDAISNARQSGFDDGVSTERSRIAQTLGLGPCK